MRSIFTCTIAALILTACSQTSITSTPVPDFTPTPRPAETNTPTATPTETNTPVPTAETAAIALFDKYNVDPATYTLAEVDGVIVGTDNETGTEIFRDGRFEISYAVDLAKKDCEPTDFEPDKWGFQRDGENSPGMYLDRLLNDLLDGTADSPHYYTSFDSPMWDYLIDREKQCWGLVGSDHLFYRDETGLAQYITTIHLTQDEIDAFTSHNK